jgi:cytochrome c oxidase subunit III
MLTFACSADVHIPYTAETRPDTGVTNSQLGIWLFLASELMLFGSLFSAYTLLRTGAASWPDQSTLVSIPLGALNTLVLLASSLAVRTRRLALTTALGSVFLAVKLFEYGEKLTAGLTPASNNFLGLYYVLTGLHAAHLLGGILVLAYLIGPGARMRITEPARYAQRVDIAALYWHFVDGIWIVLFVILYLL